MLHRDQEAGRRDRWSRKNRQKVAGLLTPSESLAVFGSEPLTLEISNLLRLPPLKRVGGMSWFQLLLNKKLD